MCWWLLLHCWCVIIYSVLGAVGVVVIVLLTRFWLLCLVVMVFVYLTSVSIVLLMFLIVTRGDALLAAL